MFTDLALDRPQEKCDSGKTPWWHFPILHYGPPGCHTYSRERELQEKQLLELKMISLIIQMTEFSKSVKITRMTSQ